MARQGSGELEISSAVPSLGQGLTRDWGCGQGWGALGRCRVFVLNTLQGSLFFSSDMFHQSWSLFLGLLMFQDLQNSVMPVFFTVHIFQSFQHFSAFKLHKALKYMLPNYIASSYWGIQIWRRTIKISFQAQMVKWPDNYEAMLRVRKRGGGKKDTFHASAADR